jgi:hypothetical protein
VLAAILLTAAAASGCLPVSDFGSDTTSASNDATADASTASTASTTSAASMTEPGSTTSAVTTGTSSSATSEPTTSEPSFTSADPTCPLFTCADFGPVYPDCDNFAQDCPEGQKCEAVITDGGGAWNAAHCVPVLGADLPGDPCTAEDVAAGLDSCIEGAMCWGVDMNGNGKCVALCQGSPDAPSCPNNGLCTVFSEGFLALCITHCDPLLQDCDVGEACYPIKDNFTCAPDASGGTGKANDPCEFINVCEAGLLCAGPEFVGAGCPPGSIGCCTPFCKFPGQICPNPDQQCIQWFDPMNLPPEPKDAASIGFCGVPQ